MMFLRCIPSCIGAFSRLSIRLSPEKKCEHISIDSVIGVVTEIGVIKGTRHLGFEYAGVKEGRGGKDSWRKRGSEKWCNLIERFGMVSCQLRIPA